MPDTTSEGKDVTQVVLQQHEQIKSLFSRLGAATGDSGEEDFCEVRRLLAVHETAEEEVIYPALRSIGDQGNKVADARTAEEREGKQVLADLEKEQIGSQGFQQTFEKLRTAVLAHAEHEEQEVLPLLRSNYDDAKRQQMGKMFELAEQAAPTHPHPHGPTSATGNIIIGPAVAIMDRVRDAIRGR